MVRRDVEAGGRRRKSRDALTSRPEVELLLHAASAPASPRELAGEQAAVDAFHRAHLVDVSTARAAPSNAGRTGLKAALAAAGAVGLLSSGFAFAATGHVPFAGTLKHVTQQVLGQGSDDSHQSGDKAGGGPKADGSASPQGPKAAALQGLCHAFARGQKATHGHALDQRPFTTLVTAAGGADQVATFCASLPAKAHQGSAGPTHPAHPTHPSKPTQAASPTHPTHPAKPTQAASPTHPTHPAKPTQAASPTHPPHPTKSPKPSHSSKPSHSPKA